MKEHYCLGVYWSEGYREQTCFFRDECQYYPYNTRWLTEHWNEIDNYVRIHPPMMPPPPNLKSKDGGKDKCHCPYFYPRGGIARQDNEEKMRLFTDGEY